MPGIDGVITRYNFILLNVPGYNPDVGPCSSASKQRESNKTDVCGINLEQFPNAHVILHYFLTKNSTPLLTHFPQLSLYQSLYHHLHTHNPSKPKQTYSAPSTAPQNTTSQRSPEYKAPPAPQAHYTPAQSPSSQTAAAKNAPHHKQAHSARRHSPQTNSPHTADNSSADK